MILLENLRTRIIDKWTATLKESTSYPNITMRWPKTCYKEKKRISERFRKPKENTTFLVLLLLRNLLKIYIVIQIFRNQFSDFSVANKVITNSQIYIATHTSPLNLVSILMYTKYLNVNASNRTRLFPLLPTHPHLAPCPVSSTLVNGTTGFQSSQANDLGVIPRHCPPLTSTCSARENPLSPSCTEYTTCINRFFSGSTTIIIIFTYTFSLDFHDGSRTCLPASSTFLLLLFN